MTDLNPEMLTSMMNMNMLMNLKSGSAILDFLFMISFMYIIPKLINMVNRSTLTYNNIRDILLFKTKNLVEIEGKRILKTCTYQTKSENMFSVRFRALWFYVNKHNFNDIYYYKEFANSENEYDKYGEDKNTHKDKTTNDIFIVNQKYPFLLTDEIYCLINTWDKELEQSNTNISGTGNTSIEVINIKLYSYTKTPTEIKDFLEKITTQFRTETINKRKDNLYIYTLINVENARDNSWNECLFASNKTFNNIFFDNKDKLLNKIDFFINNKEWYTKEGNPHTLGIALHGPPGTGKTSVIKCIANKLKRHLIVIPLNKLKTQQQFYKFYFESTYNKNNKTDSILFDNKIIVFEDIDCMSNIVCNRNTNTTAYNNTNDDGNKNDISTSDLLTAVVKGMKNEDDSEMLKMIKANTSEDSDISLSFILNIIDGLQETPGRIIILTSNMYEKLDSALVRPGRIDISLNMKNATINTICNMYEHYYKDPFPGHTKSLLKDDIISPAKLVNIRFASNNKEEFITMLLENFNT